MPVRYGKCAGSTIQPTCTGLTVPLIRKVQSSIMTKKRIMTEADTATLNGIKRQMAKPRVAKSARGGKPQELGVFPLSGSSWPGLAPARWHPKVVTHPGAL